MFFANKSTNMWLIWLKNIWHKVLVVLHYFKKVWIFLDQNWTRNRSLNLKTLDLLNFHCLRHSALFVIDIHQNMLISLFSNTIWPLSLSSNLRTDIMTLAETLWYLHNIPFKEFEKPSKVSFTLEFQIPMVAHDYVTGHCQFEKWPSGGRWYAPKH